MFSIFIPLGLAENERGKPPLNMHLGWCGGSAEWSTERAGNASKLAPVCKHAGEHGGECRVQCESILLCHAYTTRILCVNYFAILCWRRTGGGESTARMSEDINRVRKYILCAYIAREHNATDAGRRTKHTHTHTLYDASLLYYIYL